MRDGSGVVVVAAGCSLVLAETGERIVVQVKVRRVHVGLPRLQGGWCVTLQTTPRGRCCVWMSKLRAELAWWGPTPRPKRAVHRKVTLLIILW
ncbi:hypothetical protein EDB83DRAFT_2444240 [Lactarius deliciosus]|nr:hypothetical protein EDB83DRAFT_2444240 [Lactarius deliciosus]